MTLDEAIAHAKEVASEQRRRSGICTVDDSECDKFSNCINCAEEHEQLAGWLEDLKFLRQWKSDIMDSFCKYDVSSFEELVANARNKAIDDFVKEVKELIVDLSVIKFKDIDDIAEQLKEGIIND